MDGRQIDPALDEAVDYVVERTGNARYRELALRPEYRASILDQAQRLRFVPPGPTKRLPGVDALAIVMECDYRGPVQPNDCGCQQRKRRCWAKDVDVTTGDCMWCATGA